MTFVCQTRAYTNIIFGLLNIQPATQFGLKVKYFIENLESRLEWCVMCVGCSSDQLLSWRHIIILFAEKIAKTLSILGRFSRRGQKLNFFIYFYNIWLNYIYCYCAAIIKVLEFQGTFYRRITTCRLERNIEEEGVVHMENSHIFIFFSQNSRVVSRG